MKILNIKISAFGPFRKVAEIDFERFDNTEKSGLYTISGPTGAGKTTIFDAISFGLFGKMSGEFKSESEARCQYATDSEPTFVELTFSQNNKKYMVKRQPGFIKEGNKTKSPDSIVLYEINDKEQIPIATKKNAVDQKIESIINFTFQQFKQIVVLPQGEFLKILNSKSNEKEELISSILDLSIYDAIMKDTKEKFSQIYNKLRDVRTKQEQLLSTHSKNTIDELREYEQNTKIALDTAKLSLDNVSNQLTYSINEKNVYEDNNKQLENISLLEKSLNEENGKNEEFKRLERYKTRLEKIKEVSPLYNDLKRMKDEINIISSKLDSARKSKEELDERSNDIPKLEKRLSEISILLTKANLDRKEKSEAQLIKNDISSDSVKFEAAKSILESSRKHLSELEDERKKTITWMDEDRNEVVKLDAIIDSFDQKENDEVMILEEKRKKKNESVEAVRKINQDIALKNKELDEKKVELLLKRERYFDAEAKFARLELSRFSHLVEENKPCPLCGSTTHPLILCIKDETLTKSIVDNLKDEYERIDKVFTSMNVELSSLVKRLHEEETKEAYLYNDELFTNLDDRIASLLNKKKEIEISKLKKQEIGKKIKESNDRLSKIELSLKKMDIESLVENCSRISSLLESNKKKLDTIISSHDENFMNQDFDKLINELDIESKNNSRIIQKHKEDVASTNEMIKQLSERMSEIDSKFYITSSNFQKSLEERLLTIDDFRSDIDNISKIQSLDNEIKNHILILNTLKTKLETSKKNLKYNEHKDLSELESQIEKLKEEKNDKDREYGEISQLYGSISSNVSSYLILADSIKNEEEEYKLYSTLSDIVNGTYAGKRKISLKRFVIMQFLDKILIHSNKYLEAFSSGRFKLRRKEGNMNSSDGGLNLEVSDINTSKERDVSNISGGESFMASLAMSLGMSEYISSIKGGIKVENIFIDEGFGSLDDQTLDQAIETLMTLSATGSRSVGMISHVEKLQERINEGIIVKKSNTGSIIEYV